LGSVVANSYRNNKENRDFIDRSNYKSHGSYSEIYEDFETKRYVQQRSKITVNNRRMNAVAYERKRCLEHLNTVAEKSGWRKLFALGAILGGMSHGNLAPVILKEHIAPRFFRYFPHGRIYYTPVSELRSMELLRTLSELGMKYFRDYEGFASPHPVSNLDLEFNLRSTGLNVPLHFTFPYIMGINVPLAFGDLGFLTGDPLLAWGANELSAQEALSLGISGVYTDSDTPSRGVKRPILVDDSGKTRFDASDHFSYFKWYITAIQNVYALLSRITNKEDIFLASISISRILSETYLTILSEIPLLRLILAFGVLDKFANLSRELGYSRQNNELEIWKGILSDDSFIKNSTLLKGIPGLGRHFSWWNSFIQEEFQRLADEKQLKAICPGIAADKLLRTYRNCYHGYLLRGEVDRKAILSHSGEIFNEFADVVVLFWNAFLQNPAEFLSI